ncbi:MAG: hypothetical protein H6705_16945 [Myxococcales bacterium]|nr:hypothetical protein [Myxococcales bacterium]
MNSEADVKSRYDVPAFFLVEDIAGFWLECAYELHQGLRLPSAALSRNRILEREHLDGLCQEEALKSLLLQCSDICDPAKLSYRWNKLEAGSPYLALLAAQVTHAAPLVRGVRRALRGVREILETIEATLLNAHKRYPSRLQDLLPRLDGWIAETRRRGHGVVADRCARRVEKWLNEWKVTPPEKATGDGGALHKQVKGLLKGIIRRSTAAAEPSRRPWERPRAVARVELALLLFPSLTLSDARSLASDSGLSRPTWYKLIERVTRAIGERSIIALESNLDHVVDSNSLLRFGRSGTPGQDDVLRSSTRVRVGREVRSAALAALREFNASSRVWAIIDDIIEVMDRPGAPLLSHWESQMASSHLATFRALHADIADPCEVPRARLMRAIHEARRREDACREAHLHAETALFGRPWMTDGALPMALESLNAERETFTRLCDRVWPEDAPGDQDKLVVSVRTSAAPSHFEDWYTQLDELSTLAAEGVTTKLQEAIDASGVLDADLHDEFHLARAFFWLRDIAPAFSQPLDPRLLDRVRTHLTQHAGPDAWKIVMATLREDQQGRLLRREYSPSASCGASGAQR